MKNRYAKNKFEECKITQTNLIKANKINLVLENATKSNNQSNDTYSNVITESTRKTPIESFFPKKLQAKSNKNRLNSTSLLNSQFENGAYRIKEAPDNDTSKLLISNIKNIFKNRVETINSRDSDLKNKTKESQEYSYGNDLRKMEPKIKDNTINHGLLKFSIFYFIAFVEDSDRIIIRENDI